MPELLHVSPDLALPADLAGVQKYAFIGQSGAGKTYAAGKLVEELLRVGARVIVLDIVGNWYGLTIAADGKGRGFQIPVFGGERGDVPIEPTQGAAVARLVVQRDLSAVIDISRFRKAARVRFIADFAEELFHLAQTSPTQRMLVIEEAQRVAPQNARDGEKRMLGAIEDLVRLGRNYSIGSMLISQRPQSINKEVLNQATCLFVGQLSGAQERKAIELWVTEKDNADRSWLKELPRLEPGTLQVWSPAWLKQRLKVTIAKKSTYDASATLELGQVRAKRPALVQLDAAELRAELEAEAGEAPAAKGGVPTGGALPPDPIVPQLRARIAFLEEREQSTLRSVAEQLAQVRSAHMALGELLSQVTAAVKVESPARAKADPAGFDELAGVVPHFSKAKAPAPANGKSAVGSGQQRIMAALAEFYPGTVTKVQAARLGKVGMRGGTFRRYWGTLRQLGFIEEPTPGLFRATREGLKVAGIAPAPPSFEGRLAMWDERLTGGEREILHEVIKHKRPVPLDALASTVGKALRGGTFRRYVGALVTNKLIQKTDRGVQLHPWLLGEE